MHEDCTRNSFKSDIYGKLELAIYAAIWILSFMMPVLTETYNRFSGATAQINWAAVLRTELTIVPFFLLFLFNCCILIPFVFRTGKRVLYFVLATATLLLFGFLCEPISIQKPPFPPDKELCERPKPSKDAPGMCFDKPPCHKPPKHKKIIYPLPPKDMFRLLNLTIGLCIILGNLAIVQQIYSLRKDAAIKEIRNRQVQAELESLKYKISPHFLMNTLNNIQALVEISADKACDAIQDLSEMMRYLLYDTNSEQVMLSSEIRFLKSFLGLMRIRYPKNVTITFNYPGDTSNIMVPPLLFIPFVENAFKHGIRGDVESFLTVNIETTGNVLSFQCINSISPFPNSRQQRKKGIGIDTIKKRLELLFKGKYTLEIENQGTSWIVNLEIPLTKFEDI